MMLVFLASALQLENPADSTKLKVIPPPPEIKSESSVLLLENIELKAENATLKDCMNGSHCFCGKTK